ncbi:unnamed protein product, partial [Effrenium voratum]
QVVRLLSRHSLASLEPDVLSSNRAVGACALGGLGAWHAALHFFGAERQRNLITHNALLRARSDWQVSLLVLKGLSDAKLEGDITSCEAAIASCEGRACLQEAKLLSSLLDWSLHVMR